MVLVLYAYIGIFHLSEVEIQLGLAVLIDNVDSVSYGNIIEPRDTRQDSYAGATKHLVCATRYRIYVLICPIGSIIHSIALWSYNIETQGSKGYTLIFIISVAL